MHITFTTADIMTISWEMTNKAGALKPHAQTHSHISISFSHSGGLESNDHRPQLNSSQDMERRNTKLRPPICGVSLASFKRSR